MNIFFETRFSFIGKSGWQSSASRNPEQLFATDRMSKRFEYFEKISLESLKSQSDPDFKILVLSAHRMPENYKKQLLELCCDSLGPDRCEVDFNGWGLAGRVFRRKVQSIFADELETPIAQVVLDDDDAVSNDFVEVCRLESQFAFDQHRDDNGYTYISFPNGYSMSLNDEGVHLKSQRSSFINLGLTLVSKPLTDQNPFLTSHKFIGERHPTRVVDDSRPYYLRTVHSHNDSIANRQFEQADTLIENAVERFPLLRTLQGNIAPFQPLML